MDGHEVIRRQQEAFNAHDADGILALYAPTARFNAPGWAAEGTLEQMEFALRRQFRAFPDISEEILSRAVEGNVAFSEFHVRGTHLGPFRLPDGDSLPPSGQRFEFMGTIAYVLGHQGLVVSQRTYWDPSRLPGPTNPHGAHSADASRPEATFT
jgi:hypothetical protein